MLNKTKKNFTSNKNQINNDKNKIINNNIQINNNKKNTKDKNQIVNNVNKKINNNKLINNNINNNKNQTITNKNQLNRKNNNNIKNISNKDKENNLSKFGERNEEFYFNCDNYQTLVKDSYDEGEIYITISIFNSIDDILTLAYINNNNNIVTFNLIDLKKINELKYDRSEPIMHIRHHQDKKNERDLLLIILNISFIEIWDISNLNLLLSLKKVYRDESNEDAGKIYSSCFIEVDNNIYILTSNQNVLDVGGIKVFDLKGNLIKSIKNSFFSTYFLDCYLDKKLSTNFIITGNEKFIRSYNYEKNILYHKYYDNNINLHYNIVVFEKKGITKMIEIDGTAVRIWNFHSGQLIQKFESEKNSLFGMCLWDDEYLFIGTKDKNVKVLGMNITKIRHCFNAYFLVFNMKKIEHPKYGRCLITQSDSNILLWRK